MKRHGEPRVLIDLDDWHVLAVLRVLGVDAGDAAEAFSAPPGYQVRRTPAMTILRGRITLGLRELRVGGNRLSYLDIARLVGAPNHSTIITRRARARSRGLLTESEKATLRNGGAPVTHTPAIPAGEHAS